MAKTVRISTTVMETAPWYQSQDYLTTNVLAKIICGLFDLLYFVLSSV